MGNNNKNDQKIIRNLNRKMTEQISNMDASEVSAIGSSNIAAVASLLLSISNGTLVPVDASQLERLSTRVALLEAETLRQGGNIEQLEGQQVVDAAYYSNDDRFSIAKTDDESTCLYNFDVEAGHTFDFIANWSSTVPHTHLDLRKDRVLGAGSFGD